MRVTPSLPGKTVVIFALILISTVAFALTTPFKNFNEIVQNLGFAGHASVKGTKTLKIAVLDNGFRDYAKEVGKTLPTKTVYHSGPVPVDPQNEESHGLFMAQLVSGLLGQTPGVTYELHLFSSFGYSNFEAAVNKVITDKFDVVLYAQVWEYGGNGDGRGFINALVNKATQAGAIWVNASGNFGTGTFIAPVDIGADDWARLPGPNDSVRVRCTKNATGKCGLRIVLSWNDFKDDVNAGTDKDLDLIVTDDTLKIVASSAFQQMKKVPDGAPGGSLYPREIVTKEVPTGLYLVRVKARSKNFDQRRDQLRLTVSGDFIEVIDRNSENESLLPPADNAGVITIGANDSERSSSSRHLRKPELSTGSRVVLPNGEEYRGSSNSSAMAAAAVAVLKAAHPEYTRRDLIRVLSAGPSHFQGDAGEGLPLQALGFGATGGDCFKQANLPYQPPAMQKLVAGGGVPVESTKGFKIFVPMDPAQLTNVVRVSPDDMIVVSNNGFEPLPRSNQDYLPFGSYEVVQQPQGARVCPLLMGAGPGAPSGDGSATLRLPAHF